MDSVRRRPSSKPCRPFSPQISRPKNLPPEGEGLLTTPRSSFGLRLGGVILVVTAVFGGTAGVGRIRDRNGRPGLRKKHSGPLGFGWFLGALVLSDVFTSCAARIVWITDGDLVGCSARGPFAVAGDVDHSSLGQGVRNSRRDLRESIPTGSAPVALPAFRDRLVHRRIASAWADATVRRRIASASAEASALIFTRSRRPSPARSGSP